MTTDARSGCVGFVSGSTPRLRRDRTFKLHRSIKPGRAVACGSRPAGRFETDGREPRAHPYLNAVGTFTGGKIFCRKRRSHSSHSGNWSLDPSDSRGSSAVNPGGSVAISNNTSPGSLKYMERKYFRSRTGVTPTPDSASFDRQANCSSSFVTL